MRLVVKLFLLNILAGCGAPGSDTVFTKNNPKLTADSGSLSTAGPPAGRAGSLGSGGGARFATKAYRGYLRRIGADSLRFQPCGTRTPLEVFGAPLARVNLRDRIRWSSPFEGAKLYAAFQGAIVTDTVAASTAPGDSVTPGPRTRFFLVGVDSLRPWRSSDCDGMSTS